MKNKLRAITENPATGWNNCGDSFKVELHKTNESFFAGSQFEKATTPTKPASLESMIIESRNILLTLDTASERSEKKLQRVLEILGELESVVRSNIIRINTVGFSNRA